MYRIEVAGRTIVCDGKTVWSGDASTRSVVINAYKPLSTDVSLERVFFEIMSVYRSQVVQSNATSTILRLSAPEPAAVIANVTSLDVTLNASYTVTQITVASGPSRITYAISRFKRNPSIAASSFRYTPPKGWEVIDLR
jgi:outer membrane lipoprotein-sorting protein